MVRSELSLGGGVSVAGGSGSGVEYQGIHPHPQQAYDQSLHGHGQAWAFGGGGGGGSGGQDDLGSPAAGAGGGYARLREIQILKQRCSQLSADNSYLDNEKNRLEACLEAYKGGEREREQRLMEYKAQLEGMSNQLAYETKRASKANQLEIELNKVKQDALHAATATGGGGSGGGGGGGGGGAGASDNDKDKDKDKAAGSKLKSALASMNAQVESYIEEIDEISQSFDDIQRHNTKLLDQLSEQSNAQVKLREQLLKQQKDLRSCRHDMEEKERTHKEERELQRVKEQELQEIEKKYNLLELKKQSLERTLQEKDKMQRDVEAREMQLQQKVNSLQSEIEVKEQEAIAYSKKRKLESDNNNNNSGSHKNNSNSGDNADSRALKALQTQVRHYQKFVLCPICNDRHKTDIVTRCLHMFCNECIKKSLDSRNRKCPTCGIKFQASDLQKVYF